MLDRDQIVNASDLPRETVPVPEWGGEVIVQGLTAADRDSYEATIVVLGSDGETEFSRENLRAVLLVRCLVDADGKRLFGDQEVGVLGKKSALVVDRLWQRAAVLSGIKNEAVAEAEAVFEGAQVGSTSSE